MTQFNRSNPAAKQAIRFIESRPSMNAQDFNNKKAEHEFQQNQDIDAALRQPFQQPVQPAIPQQPATSSPMANVQATPPAMQGPAMTPSPAPAAVPAAQPSVTSQQITNLANTPGGGAMATKMSTAQGAASLKQEMEIFKLIRDGEKNKNPEMIRQAKYMSQQLNVGIPDYFFDDPIIRSELGQIIEQATNYAKDPRQIAAVISGALKENPVLMERIAMNHRSGKGIPEGIEAGANVAKQQEVQKSKDTRSKSRGAQNRYPEERIRLDLMKNFRKIKNDFGEFKYQDEASLMQAVEREMIRLGYQPKASKSRTYDPATGAFR